MSGATALNVALDDLVSKFSLLAARFSISAITWKKEKERFIQLGIWPEMKLATANELAKSMVPGSLKERIPRQNWNDNSLQNSNGYNSINHRAHLKH